MKQNNPLTEDTSNSTNPPSLAAVRRAMAAEGLDALVVPGTDPHQSEYPADHWKYRHWLTGFHGSAGTAVLTADHAGLWTDFRYFIAAEASLKGTEWELHRMGEEGVADWEDWLASALRPGQRAGIAGGLVSLEKGLSLQEKLAGREIGLETKTDLLDALWAVRPGLPTASVDDFPEKYSGSGRQNKLAALRDALAHHGAGAALVTPLDDVAWLLNIRGRDVPYNPVVISYLLVLPGEALWFVDPRKVPSNLTKTLSAHGVTIKGYDQGPAILGNLKASEVGASLYVPPAETGIGFCRMVGDDVPVVTGPDIVANTKAVKGSQELASWRQAMRKDGAAMVRFLMDHDRWRWGEDSSLWTEMTGVERLRHYRSAQEGFQGESFSSIVGYGPQGAIVHYNPADGDPAVLERSGLLLVDSGGHYREGTTDITRTLACGGVTAEQRRDYTLVLKGHVALSRARFPRGTCGYQLDVLARQPLWQEGCHYGHGTGHGVGFFLNVHEGPQRISPHPLPVPLLPGMVLSNEPGLYREGKWGVRIENLVAVEGTESTEFGEFYSFETLTLAPYDRSLMDTSLLTAGETEWINAYHQRVAQELAPLLTDDEAAWLQEQCRPL